MHTYIINGQVVLASNKRAAVRIYHEVTESRRPYYPTTHRPFGRLGDALQVAQSTGREISLSSR